MEKNLFDIFIAKRLARRKNKKIELFFFIIFFPQNHEENMYCKTMKYEDFQYEILLNNN